MIGDALRDHLYEGEKPKQIVIGSSFVSVGKSVRIIGYRCPNCLKAMQTGVDNNGYFRGSFGCDCGTKIAVECEWNACT